MDAKSPQVVLECVQSCPNELHSKDCVLALDKSNSYSCSSGVESGSRAGGEELGCGASGAGGSDGIHTDFVVGDYWKAGSEAFASTTNCAKPVLNV
jgi:hypothetical protein